MITYLLRRVHVYHVYQTFAAATNSQGMQTSQQSILFLLPLCEVHDQKYSGSGEHIDLSVFQTQTGPDKVVITVGGVYTIT